MMNTRRQIWGLVWWLGGCAPDDDLALPPAVWEGQSVRVRMDDPDIQVCGGSFESLDRHAELVREALMLEGEGIIEYSIGDQELVNAACDFPFDGTSAACTDSVEGRVFTAIPFIPHEIVHAVRIQDPQIGLLSSVFEEGMAMVYGDDFLESRPIPLDLFSILDSTYVRGAREYYYAGHMTAKLLERHGMAAFRRFDELAYGQDESKAFQEIFGETIEEFAVIAEAEPICEQTQWWIPLLECDGDAATEDPDTGTVLLAGNLRCGEPDVRGPSRGVMWTSRHFRLGDPASLVDFDMPEDATLEVVACDGGCPERFAYIGTRYEVGSFGNGLPGLEAGEYFLRMSRPVSDDDGWFELELD
jgi:hypothetical protein